MLFTLSHQYLMLPGHNNCVQFVQQILNEYNYMPGAVLGIGNAMVNKANSSQHELTFK